MNEQLMLTSLSLFIALMAFAVSALTFYFVHFKNGRVISTQPSSIFFGFDQIQDRFIPKVVVFNTLFATAQKGNVVENIYLKIKTDNVETLFAFWGYRTSGDLVRGGGIFIPQSGFTASHNFSPKLEEGSFVFQEGSIAISIIGQIFRRSKPQYLRTVTLRIGSDEKFKPLLSGEAGILWNWNPEEKNYEPEPMHKYPRIL